MHDIAHLVGREAVLQIVSDFYDEVRQHPLLSTPFGIVHDWAEHKAHLSHFWWVTLGGKPYRNQPYRVADKHASAGFTPALLVEWLALFRQTLAKHLPEDLADQWYARAAHIGRSLELMHEFRLSRAATSHQCVLARA
jgi:hemoglobin